MADNYLITGYWGEPHVTSENDRGINAAIFGAGRFVLPVGEQFRAEYIGNNTVRMYDGKLMNNGAAAGIPAGEYIDLLIPEAGQGMKRNDIIVFQYSQDRSTLIEKGVFVVISGEETSGTAADPVLFQEDLLTNEAMLDQMALWRVSVSGTVISAPVQLFEVSKNIRNAGTAVVEATSSDGVAYSATVPGITELYNGLELTIIPNVHSESTVITLDVNGLGAKFVRLPTSFSTAVLIQTGNEEFFTEARPVKLMYDSKYINKGSWVVIGRQRQFASDLYGSVPVQNGGWLIDTNTTDEDKAEALESLLSIGLAPYGDYATKNYVSTQISQAKLDGQNVDLSGYATKDDISKITTTSLGAVPKTRKVNGKALSTDITLSASDVSAVPTSRKINNKTLSADISLDASDVGARPDTWMPTAAQVGAAPSGYGLGEAVLISIATIDNQVRPGWYYSNESGTAAGFSSNRWWLHVKAYGTGTTFATQELYSFTGTRIVQLERHKINGTWEEWEWCNPIMIPGTEYRTTERWNGQPVYAKLLVWESTSAMNGTGRYEIPHGISNLNSASLRIEWSTEEWTLPHVSTTEALYISGVDADKNSSKLIVKTSGNAMWDAGRTFYFYMKYCKA